MKKRSGAIRLKNEAEELEFWSKTDSTRFIKRSSLHRARFPELRPTTRPIPLRLPETTIDRLKVLAHKNGIPYQALMRRWIEAGLENETRAGK